MLEFKTVRELMKSLSGSQLEKTQIDYGRNEGWVKKNRYNGSIDLLRLMMYLI